MIKCYKECRPANIPASDELCSNLGSCCEEIAIEGGEEDELKDLGWEWIYAETWKSSFRGLGKVGWFVRSGAIERVRFWL